MLYLYICLGRMPALGGQVRWKVAIRPGETWHGRSWPPLRGEHIIVYIYIVRISCLLLYSCVGCCCVYVCLRDCR